MAYVFMKYIKIVIYTVKKSYYKHMTAYSKKVSVRHDDTGIGLGGRILFAILLNHSPTVAAFCL